MRRQQEDGLLTWVLLSLAVAAIMFFLAWVTGSHKIVYYSAKLFDLLSFPWRLLPTDEAKQAVADLDMSYVLAMRHAAYIRFGDWLSYANLVFQPWSYFFILLVVLLTLRQFKQVKERLVNKKLTPDELAKITSETFSEIAPILGLQEKLVNDELPGWRRQTFPVEMLKELRYQGQSVLVPNEQGVLEIDEARLRGCLTYTSTYKHKNQWLLFNEFLGRQIVDFNTDLKQVRAGKKLTFVDRLSNEGKAIYAILAPYAFDKIRGRERSGAIKDALNYSAYGSEQGLANLTVAQEGFNEWRDNQQANRLALKHHWEYPFLSALLELAQRRGKVGTWQFIWLKPMNRIMFYCLNTVGRHTPHAQAALCFSQIQFDKEVAKQGRLPVIREGNKLQSVIYADKVIKSFHEEWKFWIEASEDSVEGDYAFDYDENSAGIEALLKDLEESNISPHVPEEANI